MVDFQVVPVARDEVARQRNVIPKLSAENTVLGLDEWHMGAWLVKTLCHGYKLLATPLES